MTRHNPPAKIPPVARAEEGERTIYYGVRIGDRWLLDGVGRVICHESFRVMQAQCDMLRNPDALVEEI